VREPSVRRTAFALAPAVLLAGFAGGIAFPILPIVGERQGLHLAFIGVILAANRAMRVVSMPFVGALTDRIGGRRTLVLGLAFQIVVMLFYLAGLAPGMAGSFFLAGRILHGPASACVFVAGQSLALQAGGRDHAGEAGALVRAAMAIGVPVGIVAGGFLAEGLGDRATFEIATAAIVLGAVAAWVWVPDLRARLPARSNPGDAFAGLAQKPLAAIGAMNFASNFAAQGMVLSTLVLMVEERHVALFAMGPQATASSLMGLMLIVESVAMPFMGRAGDRHAAHAWFGTAGAALLALGLSVTGVASSNAVLGAGLSLIGLGTGALGPSLLALVPRWVPPERRGVGVGALQLCGDAGGALGPLVGTALLAGSTRAPYFASAALVVCLLPAGTWLIGRERASRGTARQLLA
jgi:MFS transporter, DHA1 family, multidrug resistance protein